MGFPVGGSAKNYSSSGAGNNSQYIPVVWSTKTLDKFFEDSIYEEVMLTDYEDEIQGLGDEVKIRSVPDITISDYVKGAGLSYEDPESPPTSLLIDQGHYAAFNLYDVDRIQSDLNLMDKWATDASDQMRKRVNLNIFSTVFLDAASENSGNTAGKHSGDIDLGSSGTPVALTKDNIIDWLVDVGVVMDEQELPDSDRYCLLPPHICALIKKSELKDASITGDGQSILRSGLIGMVDRLKIYSTNRLNNVGGTVDVIAGHKSALQFAAQITENETLKNPNDFGDLARMLLVYGFKCTLPSSLVHGVVQRGA